jgi:hypothetical protein
MSSRPTQTEYSLRLFVRSLAPDQRRRAWHPIPVGDAQKASQKAKDKRLDKLIKDHLANQLNALERLSESTKRKRKDGFMLD